MPEMQLKRLVLPAPLGPISAVRPPRVDGERDVVERGDAAEADVSPSISSACVVGSCQPPPPAPVALRRRERALGLARSRHRGRAPGPAGPGATALAGPSSTIRPRVEDVRVVAELEREARVLLDDQHRRPVRCDRTSRRRSKIERVMIGASPSETSSSSSSRGLAIRPRPIATICCSPPDSQPAWSLRREAMLREELEDCGRCPRPCSPPLRAVAPMRRFSSTVSSANTIRPSGTWATPWATILFGRSFVMSLALELDSAGDHPPECSRSSPEMARIVVVLPAPLAPSSATAAPSGTSSVTPAQRRRARAVGDLEPGDLEHGARALAAPAPWPSRAVRPLRRPPVRCRARSRSGHPACRS